jgi:transcriptional regulator GlxA family with amidase domain
MNPKTVGLVVFEQMAAADLTGPAEAFSRATIRMSDTPSSPERFRSCYQTLTIGIDAKSCVTECGIVIKPHRNIESAPPLDTLIICGGSGIHDAKLSRKLVKWLKHRAPMTRRAVALGSGIYVLAATGLLDGRRVAVHWRLAKDVALRFANLRVNPNALFIRDGPFYTCPGGAAAIDLSLSLIEEDYGRQVALVLAREFVLHFKRSGELEQYSQPLQFQIQSSDRFADLSAWILSNLSQDLSVEALAQRACMSPRNFSRLFKTAFGKTPAEFVARLRITEARERLLIPRNSIENVAASVGFKSADAFSRTFERLVGVRPSTYRGGCGVVPADNFQKSRKAFGMPRRLVRA